MSKYETLIDKLTRTRESIYASKEKINEIMVNRLAEYLGCSPEMLTVAFGYTQLVDPPSPIVVCDFRLNIVVEGPTEKDLLTLDNFSYNYRSEGEKSSLTIKFNSEKYNTTDSTDHLFKDVYEKMLLKYI